MINNHLKKKNLTKKLGHHVDLFYEIGSLMNIKRAWGQFLGDEVRNNIEHSFRVTIIALTIARLEGVGNEEKIIKMALFHDLSESRSIDIAFAHRSYVDRHERQAAKDQLTNTVFSTDILPLLQEYKARKSIESLIVKDADHLEVDLELREQAEFGNKVAESYIKNFRLNVSRKIFTKTGQRLWQEIYRIKPFSWHNKLINNWINSKKFSK